MTNLYVLLEHYDGKKHLFRVYKDNDGAYYTKGKSLCGKVELDNIFIVNEEDIIYNVQTIAAIYFSTESIVHLDDTVCHLCRGFAS